MRLPLPIFPLETGLIVGHTTSRTSRIWVRLPRPGHHALEVRREGSGAEGLSIGIGPDPERDATAVVDLEGLEPDATYALDLRGPGGERALEPWLAPRVRTLPEPSGELSGELSGPLVFGVMSCHQPFEVGDGGALGLAPTAGMLASLEETLEREGARALLAIGDQIYADGPGPLDVAGRALGEAELGPAGLLERYRELYRAFWAPPALRRIFARFPTYMIWDDHDVCDNWGSHPPADAAARERQAQVFEAARRAYLEYQHAHNPDTPEGAFHYAFQLGPLPFFVMDLRGQRSAERRELLGEAQWRDLEAWEARTRGYPLRFLVSSVPLRHVPETLTRLATRRPGRAPAPLYDRWGAEAFHGELERLLALLAPPSDAGDAGGRTVLLAGDVHIGGALEIALSAAGRGAGRGPCLQQWITSPVTNPRRESRLQSRIAVALANVGTRWPVRRHFFERRNNFGLVRLTPTPEGLEALFELYAWNGRRAVLAHALRSSPGHRGAIVLPDTAPRRAA